MPGIYTTAAYFAASPLGNALAGYTANLSGSLDQMIIEASTDCDNFTGRKLGAPPTTTLSADALSGARSVSVANCAGVYPEDVLLFTATGEMHEVTGADPVYSITNGAAVGTIYLNAALSQGYSSAAPVQVYRQFRYTILGRATDPIDSTPGLSQAGQLAAAHAPPMGQSQSARIVFLDEWPLWSIYAAYLALPWTGVESANVDISNAYINRGGSFRLPVGFYNPLGSKWRVQYFAGYTAIPQDIRDACHLYMADKIARAMNPIGADTIRNEDVMVRMTRNTATAGQPLPASMHVETAQRILARYKKRGYA